MKKFTIAKKIIFLFSFVCCVSTWLDGQSKNVYITPGAFGKLFQSGGLTELLRNECRRFGYELIQANDLASLQDPEYIVCFDVPSAFRQLEQLVRYPKEKCVLIL